MLNVVAIILAREAPREFSGKTSLIFAINHICTNGKWTAKGIG